MRYRMGYICVCIFICVCVFWTIKIGLLWLFFIFDRNGCSWGRRWACEAAWLGSRGRGRGRDAARLDSRGRRRDCEGMRVVRCLLLLFEGHNAAGGWRKPSDAGLWLLTPCSATRSWAHSPHNGAYIIGRRTCFSEVSSDMWCSSYLCFFFSP